MVMSREIAAGFHIMYVAPCCQKSGNTLNTMVKLSPFYSNRFPDRFLQEVYERAVTAADLDLLIKSGRLFHANGVYFCR